MLYLQENEKKFLEKITNNYKASNPFVKNIQVNLPLKPVITKRQLKFNDESNIDIKKITHPSKQLDPINAPKKINTNILAVSIQRKPSARSEKVSINCEESIDSKNATERKNNNNSNNINSNQIEKKKINKNNKNKPVKKTINISKSLGSFKLLDNDYLPEEEGSFELDLNSAIEKQKEEKYKALKTFLSEVKMPDLFQKFAKENIFNSEQIENLCDFDLKKMKIAEKDRKVMLSYIKELKMRNELSAEGDFGTQCDSKNYYNDPVTDDIEENERIQSELFKKAVEEFRNRNKDPKDINKEKEENAPVDKSMKSSTTNISENPIINPKNFLLEIGNSDMLNLNNLCLFANNGNDMKEDQEMDPELVSTQACWNCFKIMNIDKAIIYEERLFCSEKCLVKYKKKNDIRCCYCHKNFLKYNGIISGDKLFCSSKCYKDEKNSIKEIEGGEDNEDENEDNNLKNKNKIYLEEPHFVNQIDILDIQLINYFRRIFILLFINHILIYNKI